MPDVSHGTIDVRITDMPELKNLVADLNTQITSVKAENQHLRDLLSRIQPFVRHGPKCHETAASASFGCGCGAYAVVSEIWAEGIMAPKPSTAESTKELL